MGDSIDARREPIAPLAHSQISLGQELGKGSFSSVFAITSIRSNKKDEKYNAKNLVVKVLKPSLVGRPAVLATCAADLYKEAIIMSSFSHPNILNAQAWA